MVECLDPKGIGGRTKEYFEELFISINSLDPTIHFEGFKSKVSSNMTRNLTRPISKNEVKRAMFSINPFSVPGDDGFNAKFYQFLGEVVKEDVIQAVRSFFASGRMLKSFNHTQMCLIPKVRNAISMAQVRPISRCTVFYKVISKILVH